MLAGRNFYLGIYGLAAIGELFSIAIQYESLHLVCKTMLMPALAMYVIKSFPKGHSVIFRLTLAAIFFSWIGDVSLMFQHQNELYFIVGLGGFLIAHLLYIVLYSKASDAPFFSVKGSWAMSVSYFLVVVYGVIFLVKLIPSLGELLAPVVIYAIVLLGMVIAALMRYLKTSKRSFYLVLIGAVLFMLSDSTIAINKFLKPFEGANIFIMTTYIVAQALIVLGIQGHMSTQED